MVNFWFILTCDACRTRYDDHEATTRAAVALVFDAAQKQTGHAQVHDPRCRQEDHTRPRSADDSTCDLQA